MSFIEKIKEKIFKTIDDPGIKVLMMGGARCGKTSALASMFDQFENGEANNFFTVIGDSPILRSKKRELMRFLETPTTNTFLVDEGPTNEEEPHTIYLKIPGARAIDKTAIHFFDCPGEYFQRPERKDQAAELVKKCDVFVVVIDTPYLMEAPNSENIAINAVDQLNNLLNEIETNGDKDSKMVMFVPVKCEKWIKENRINELLQRVEEVYHTPIQTVKAYSERNHNMNVCILPIQTCGNILFSELHMPYLITINGTKYKCCKIDENLVRLSDGKPHTKSPNDILNEDPWAIVPGTDLPGAKPQIRKQSWYHVNPNADKDKPLYQPFNCDQLALHVLRFMVKKMSVEGKSGVWTFFFGGISKGEMEKKMKEIENVHLIKEDVEGITYLTKDI